MPKLTDSQVKVLKRLIARYTLGSHRRLEDECHAGSVRVLRRLGYIEYVKVPAYTGDWEETHNYPTPAGVAALVREGHLDVEKIDAMTEEFMTGVAKAFDSYYPREVWRHNQWRPICEAAGATVRPPAEGIPREVVPPRQGRVIVKK